MGTNPMDLEQRALFDETLRRAAEAHTGPALDRALSEIGWHGALADDTASAVRSLFEHQGRAGVTSCALDDVLAFALGVGGGGTLPPAVVLPALEGADPPGSFDAGRMTVTGLGTARVVDAHSAVVVCAAADGALATVDATELTRRPVAGMDPALGLVEVSGTAMTGTTPAALEAGRWREAVRLSRLAVSHELVGASAAMAELARVHALERVQFGRPIASFQAVRHRLADTVVALEAARALLDGAWVDATSETAAMAKAVAGRSARTIGRHAQQVLAGMGFTTAHPLHRYVRRVLVLDSLFGSSHALTSVLGRDVLARRRLPAPIPL